MKKAVVSVTNDLATDQRVKRSIDVLLGLGFDVTFVGRELPSSMPIERSYTTRRFKLWFNKGFLFYANYNLRLFFFLLFKKYDLYLSNDLDTLLPNYLVSKWKNKPLVYDSHEYFTGVPELVNRPFKRKIWQTIEAFIFPKLKDLITVNDSIAALYRAEYNKELVVVRNISDSSLPDSIKSRKELCLPNDAFIMINQGAGINVERGMEEAIEALVLLPEKVFLLIVGNGDVLPTLKELVKAKELEGRVKFVPKQPYLEMLQYTINSDCGLSLDKPNSPNYQFSLPNKLFDYIKCGLPVVVSEVIEVKKVVDEYQIGEIIKSHNPQSIASSVLKMIEVGKVAYRKKLAKAAQENNWETEQKKLIEVFAKFS